MVGDVMTEPMDAGTTLPVIPRLFTPEEADALVQHLEASFRRMDPLLVRVREIQDLLEDEASYWGGDVSRAPPQDQAGHAALAAELGRARTVLDAEVSAVRELGVEVKDVAMGLVDFYAQRDGDIVYLCWQRGEPRVGHWHPLEGGFAGRRPLEPRRKGEP
ncbi:MAG: hypothetical protein A3K59_07145 [Euryarchaeota archaeon RBG_19FT_COMBO_69_17]|nr:MAG: hypothetical protein A3K59_07145 [Euryarchaeota archaeon RBG_19FT_COMBO_69_17]